MPRSNRRLYRTSTKKKAKAPQPATASTTPPSAAPLPPTTQSSSPPPTSFGAALAHGVASGVGWGVGTSAVKAALGLGGDAGSGGGDSPSTTPNAGADTGHTLPTFPADACGTLWVAYQRCLYESGGRACDPVKEGLDAVCPGFQAPLDSVVREATTPTYALSLPPL